MEPWITIGQLVDELSVEQSPDQARRYFLNAWQPQCRTVELDQQRVADDYRRLAGAPDPAPVLVQRDADVFGLVEHHVWTRQTWVDVVAAAAVCDRNPCTCAAVSRAVIGGRRNGRATARRQLEQSIAF